MGSPGLAIGSSIFSPPNVSSLFLLPQRDARGGNERKVQTHQPPNATVASPMRPPLNTRPRLNKRLLLIARVEEALRSAGARGVAHEARDAVVRQQVSRPQPVDVARERPVGDAAVLAHAVAAEARGRVEDV